MTPVRALHVGGGGGTLARYLADVRPGSDNLVFEIDQGVVDLDVEELGLRLGDGVDVQIRDGRTGVARQPADSRDFVIGDAFGGVAVPWHLTTREAISDIDRVLKADGVYVLNTIDYPPQRFVRAEIATLLDVFEHVALIARPEILDGGRAAATSSSRRRPAARPGRDRREPALAGAGAGDDVEARRRSPTSRTTPAS